MVKGPEPESCILRENQGRATLSEPGWALRDGTGGNPVKLSAVSCQLSTSRHER